MRILNNKYIKIRICFCFISFLIVSCVSLSEKKIETKTNENAESSDDQDFAKNHRAARKIAHQKKRLIPKKKRLAKDLYATVTYLDIPLLKETLTAGADPNYCLASGDWLTSNPLNVLSLTFFGVYENKLFGRPYMIPDDEQTLKLLLDAGADINQRPYIWAMVFRRNNDKYKSVKESAVERKGFDPGLKELQAYLRGFVYDMNRLLESFIIAGADPDKLGHLVPYSNENQRSMNDELAKEYFAKGTRPINEAIKKGMIWESQVDLLLKYVKLDENSLKAAKESEDPSMIEKIEKLWKKQQEK